MKTMKSMEDAELSWQRESMANIASGIYNPFGAVNLHESPFATQSKSARTHKHRSGQRSAYHKRVQKKWDKRFGKVETP